MIEFQDVCYAYERIPVLQHVNFTIQPGDAVLLAGPNGTGKSTILKILNGLIYPGQGKYLFYGREITEKLMREHKYSKWYHQKVGFVWQNPDVQLFCGSVEEELAFGPQQMGLPEEEVLRRVEDAIALLHLENLRMRAPYYLSGGEKKKTAIAAILTMNPEIWTMDEPLSALDEKTQLWLVDFLKALKKSGKTLIISTHDKTFARDFADYRILLNEEHEARIETL
jgi:cobalt/nickel transport system ATP-binding protein